MRVEGQVAENGLELRFQECGGFQVVARRKLKAGAAVLQEPPLALAVPATSLSCRKCLLPVPRAIGLASAPQYGCRRCAHVLYCSSRCRNSHLSTHIRSGECSLLTSPAARDGLCGLLREACMALQLLQCSPVQPELCSNQDKLLGKGDGALSEQTQALSFAAEQAHAAWVQAQEDDEDLSDSEDSPRSARPVRQIQLGDVHTALCQVVTNCVEVLPATVGMEGESDVPTHQAPLALYRLLSRLNHSCHPTAHYHWNPNNMLTVRLVRDVEAGEPLTITYLDLLTPRHQRLPYLSFKYQFHCDCPRCRLPNPNAAVGFVPPPDDFWLTAVAAPLPDRPAGSQDTLWVVRVAGDTGVDDAREGGGMLLVAAPESGPTSVVGLEKVSESHQAACWHHMVHVESMIQQGVREAEAQLLGQRDAAGCLSLAPPTLQQVLAQGLHPFHHSSLQLYALMASAAVEAASRPQAAARYSSQPPAHCNLPPSHSSQPPSHPPQQAPDRDTPTGVERVAGGEQGGKVSQVVDTACEALAGGEVDLHGKVQGKASQVVDAACEGSAGSEVDDDGRPGGAGIGVLELVSLQCGNVDEEGAMRGGGEPRVVQPDTELYQEGIMARDKDGLHRESKRQKVADIGMVETGAAESAVDDDVIGRKGELCARKKNETGDHVFEQGDNCVGRTVNETLGDEVAERKCNHSSRKLNGTFGDDAPNMPGATTEAWDTVQLTAAPVQRVSVQRAWGSALCYSLLSAVAIQSLMQGGSRGLLPAAAKAWSILTHITCAALKALLELDCGMDMSLHSGMERTKHMDIDKQWAGGRALGSSCKDDAPEESQDPGHRMEACAESHRRVQDCMELIDACRDQEAWGSCRGADGDGNDVRVETVKASDARAIADSSVVKCEDGKYHSSTRMGRRVMGVGEAADRESEAVARQVRGVNEGLMGVAEEADVPHLLSSVVLTHVMQLQGSLLSSAVLSLWEVVQELTADGAPRACLQRDAVDPHAILKTRCLGTKAGGIGRNGSDSGAAAAKNSQQGTDVEDMQVSTQDAAHGEVRHDAANVEGRQNAHGKSQWLKDPESHDGGGSHHTGVAADVSDHPDKCAASSAKWQKWLCDGFNGGLPLQLAQVCAVFVAHSVALHEEAYGDTSLLAEACAFLPFTAEVPMQQAAAITAAAAAIGKKP